LGQKKDSTPILHFIWRSLNDAQETLGQKRDSTLILYFIWRSLNDALMTNGHRARVIPGIDDTCMLCNNGVESVAHILLHCPSVTDVWCHNNIDFHIMVDDDVG